MLPDLDLCTSPFKVLSRVQEVGTGSRHLRGAGAALNSSVARSGCKALFTTAMTCARGPRWGAGVAGVAFKAESNAPGGAHFFFWLKGTLSWP